MTKQPKNILQQGELDQFCLLYSVLNAFISACPGLDTEAFKKDHQDIWARMIAVTPSLQNFASRGSILQGIPKSSLDVQLKQALLSQYAEILSSTMRKIKGYQQIEILPVDGNLDEWKDELSESSVPEGRSWLCCLKPSSGVLKHPIHAEHWIAIVGGTKEGPAVACSYTAYNLGMGYKEKQVRRDDNRRFYNNMIIGDLNEETIFKKSRYVLQIS
ncbi:hypothetical protein [Marinobacter halophilus]|uniref:Uncharacterized protein n=1 Tax=Marinobacter halophilus TaxID=1323740 RepID=A0A2T1KGZ3_9GAMM|nr:hypothetical protein [Marinobacter halophilus]PSF09023.1 hypothetical protein C7H08_06385 [Marinobacter halophilus]GGC77301.1 hypothetical protein GCM10011362_27350 [Marinobacter halophilus]